MFLARSKADLNDIKSSVNGVKKLSDRIIGIGPVGIGLDGILAWFPVVGPVYSVIAGGILMVHGVRARASVGTLVKMGAILVVDTMLDGTGGPIFGALDTVFTGHKWSANLLTKHIDNTFYIEASEAEARQRPDYPAFMARMRKERRRVVFLG